MKKLINEYDPEYPDQPVRYMDIVKAGKVFTEEIHKPFDTELGFKAGALSDAAKEFHQQGLYTEKEVLRLLENFVNNKTNNLRMNVVREWFNQNKKK